MRRNPLRTAAPVLLVVVCALVVQQLSASGARSASGPPDTIAVSAEDRAAGPRWVPGIAASDRAWIEAAMAAARPEAKLLIGEVDGLVSFTTHTGDPFAVTRPAFGGDRASFEISFNIAELNGRRVQDREGAVLHELGHAIDLALVDQATNDKLDAGIPRTGSCGETSGALTGSCTEPMERFADTFAKWALRGRLSAVGAGYDVATPPSLEDWGAPLTALAIGLSQPR